MRASLLDALPKNSGMPYVTWYDAMRSNAIEEGRKQAFRQAREEELSRSRALLIKQAQAYFKCAITAEQQKRINTAGLTQLQHWLDEIFNAASPEALLKL